MLNRLMGIVPNAAEHGRAVDHMLEFCHWFMFLLFIGWSVFFLYTIFRFHRSRNPRANYHGVKSKASAHLEFIVVLVEAVLLLGFALPLWGYRVTADNFPDRDAALRVRAVGEQFAWNFHYTGADGVFGRQSAQLVSGSNPLGLDPQDPAGADDYISKNELYIINHKPTVIEISAKDVIHSFSVHHMRITQDAIPGSSIPLWFRPIREGSYEIVCAQLCGSGHYAMKAMMNVVNQEAFDTWAEELASLRRPAAAAPGAAAPGAAAPAADAPPAAPAAPNAAPAAPVGSPPPSAAAPAPDAAQTAPAAQ